MKLFTCAFLLCCLPFAGAAQTNVKQNFIVVHFDARGKTQFRQKIYSYHFLNGSYTGRDELMTVDGRKDGHEYIRTDKGHGTLYKERYLITGSGNILDLVEKKVLFDGKGSLVRCSNDSAIFYVNDAFKGKFYAVYDFKEQKYKEVKSVLFKPRLGRDVEFDKTSVPFKLNYYPPNKPKVTLSADAGYGQAGTREKDNFVPDPPILWIDNDNFIYTSFNKENTEVAFYKVNVETRDNSLLAKLPMDKNNKEADVLNVTQRQSVMQIGTRQYFIDLDAETVTELQLSRPVNGFAYELKTSPSGRLIKLYNRDIGRFHFEPNFFVAGNNITGFVKELVIGGDHYQQGMMVWNESKKNWEKVEAEEVLALIGWIRE